LGQLHRRRAQRLQAPHRAVRQPSDALRTLCAGSISVEEYLLTKLELALHPLAPLLRPDDLKALRVAMSERISAEPMWRSVAEELRAAVGRERANRGTSDDR